MSTFNESAVFRIPTVSGRFKVFFEEAWVVLDAMTSPNKIIAEVKQMRALQVEADRVEAADPERAVALRQRASRMCRR